ncbi:MAG TPA: HAD family hydrolase [Acidimicrobiia bacterium]|nr:HAD family hydrolase [Acidimicrobiia bacterium]
MRIEPGSDSPEPSNGQWLLISDVDGTLTGDAGSLADLLEEMSEQVTVVLSSSRPVASVRRTVMGFPGRWMPAGIVGALGTEIEIAGRPDRLWNQRFASWDRRPVDAVMAEAGFESHPAEFQTPAKASFTVPSGRWDEARAAIAGLAVEAKILVSAPSNFDVLAPGAGKEPAARHVATTLGVAPDRVATAGDEVIDLDMLSFGRGILVGNARDEVRAAAPDGVYHADQPFAAGVREGLVSIGALRGS